MKKNNKIILRDKNVKKPSLESDDRQSSFDSCTTLKSSEMNEGHTSTMSTDSKNSSGSQKTSSSQGSSEIEAKERTFGSINLHPLPDTQTKPTTETYHSNIRYKTIRLANIHENNLSKILAMHFDKSPNPNVNISTTNKPTGCNKQATKQSRIADYILEKTIGKGNFAVVKLARHAIINTKAAIKIMNKSLLGPENLEKVTREIEAMKRIEHPHVIKLYQVLESDSKIFMVMEYADKGEVFDHISMAHAFTEKDARELFWQVICAVHYCHRSGIVHRDLKAENLLLNTNYQIKVADFGFCNFFEANKLLSTHCGSPQYAAPEVFKGELYDGPLADVWSLGVVLYIMVCGSFPFPGESLGDIRNQVLRGLVRFPFFLSTSCEYLVRGMLQVDPIKRFKIDQIIATPWMLASNNVDKYRSLMEIYNRKAIENKFQEIFHRQHPEHSDIIREQMYHSSKINIDSALQLALQMVGFDEDEVKNSVINKTFDRVNAAYNILKDKVCRYFNNPLLKLHLEAAHCSILKSASQWTDERMRPDTYSDTDEIDSILTTDDVHNPDNTDLSKEESYKRILQMPYNYRKNSLSYVKTNFCANSDVMTMGKLYYWVLQSNEEFLINRGKNYSLEDNPVLQSNVRRHTVQLTEMPKEFKKVSNFEPGFPIPSTQPDVEESKDEKDGKVTKVGSAFRKKQISLDSTRSQTTPKLNLPKASSNLVKTRHLADIRHNESGTLNYSTHPTAHWCAQQFQFSESVTCHLSDIVEHPSTMDSDSTTDNDEYITSESSRQDVIMGSTDSTNWTVMKNLPQLNLPVNLPALVHQPMAKFTIKDPHLLAPPDFMTPYNSCFPRRSSDGAADMQPLHRSNPGVGGSYPEQTAHKYRSQNESLYDAVVKQIVPSSKENYMNDISPLEFIGLHLKRFSLPMNGSYNIQNNLYPDDSGFNQFMERGIMTSHCSETPISYRRGSEDSQMSLWHKQVARSKKIGQDIQVYIDEIQVITEISGYIDSGSQRSYMFTSAPASRGSSPYPMKTNSIPGGTIFNRKKSLKHRSVDHLSRNSPASIYESFTKKDKSLSRPSDFCDNSSHDSPSKFRKTSQPVLDLQELKAELQNLAILKSNKEEVSTRLTYNTSSMIIPSISLSPIDSEDVNFSSKNVRIQDSFVFGNDDNIKRLENINTNTNILKTESLQKKPVSSPNDINLYQRQMYLHWFPGIIRSGVNAPPDNISTIQNQSKQSESPSTSECSLLSYQNPPPLSYYSPFMRDEDAADLAAIERVNRKVSQVDSFGIKPLKKEAKYHIDNQTITECRDLLGTEFTISSKEKYKGDTVSIIPEFEIKPEISLQESQSVMELSLGTKNCQRPRRPPLSRGYSAEETYSFSMDNDNGSMDCEPDNELSTIQEMDSS